jgi:hypothetical protein
LNALALKPLAAQHHIQATYMAGAYSGTYTLDWAQQQLPSAISQDSMNITT